MSVFQRLDPRTSLVDVAVVGWLVCTAPLLAVHPARGDVARLGIHGILVVLVLALRSYLAVCPAGSGGMLRVVHATYPFPLLAYLYKELDVLQGKVGTGFHDAQVEGWEWALFGSSPAAWLSQVLPYPWLSEVLHLAYLAFYIVLPLLALSLLWRGKARDFQLVTFTGISTFLACYFVSMLYPVQGPRPLYPALDPQLCGMAWSLSHALCAQGAANGAAFPSGHVAVALVTAACAWRWNRPLFPLFALWAVLIAMATVYGRYHYAVDAVAGACVACAMAWGGPRIFNEWCEWHEARA